MIQAAFEQGRLDCPHRFILDAARHRPQLCTATIPEKTKPRQVVKPAGALGITGGQGQNRTADTRIFKSGTLSDLNPPKVPTAVAVSASAWQPRASLIFLVPNQNRL